MALKPEPISAELIRHEQARRLRAASSGSSRLVLVIIANAAFLMAVAGLWKLALAWTAVATTMVFFKRSHSRYRFAGEALTPDTSGSFIAGHVALTALTGLVWSAFAILTVDPASELSIMLAAMVLTSISLGGVLPGSAHRGDYIAMASAALLPYSIWLLAVAQAPQRFFGVGMLLLYGVLLIASRRVHEQSLDAITSGIRQSLADAGRVMVSSIGHDLAQPLLAQRNYLEVLRRTSSDARHAELFRKIEHAQASQEYLIGMLSEHERLQRHSFEPYHEPVNLVALAESLIEENDVAATNGTATTVLAKPVRDAGINTDRHLVSAILRNLLSNARKYTPEDGQITVSIKTDRSRGVISVADTGIGIAPADQSRVFEPYVRVASSDLAPGLGLGLASVRQQVALLGGSVTLESEPDVGTTVTVTLPNARLAP